MYWRFYFRFVYKYCVTVLRHENHYFKNNDMMKMYVVVQFNFNASKIQTKKQNTSSYEGVNSANFSKTISSLSVHRNW